MSSSRVWTKPSILVLALLSWVALAGFSTVCIGVWLLESGWIMDYTLRAEGLAAGMPWLILGAALSVVALICGRLLGGRWWDSALAVAPAIVVVGVELTTGVAMTLIGHALFLPTVVIATIGAGAVIHGPVKRIDRLARISPARTAP